MCCVRAHVDVYRGMLTCAHLTWVWCIRKHICTVVCMCARCVRVRTVCAMRACAWTKVLCVCILPYVLACARVCSPRVHVCAHPCQLCMPLLAQGWRSPHTFLSCLLSPGPAACLPDFCFLDPPIPVHTPPAPTRPPPKDSDSSEASVLTFQPAALGAHTPCSMKPTPEHIKHAILAGCLCLSLSSHL